MPRYRFRDPSPRARGLAGLHQQQGRWPEWGHGFKTGLLEQGACATETAAKSTLWRKLVTTFVPRVLYARVIIQTYRLRSLPFRFASLTRLPSRCLPASSDPAGSHANCS